MSMTEEEKAMLAEVAKDAASRNYVRRVEANYMKGRIIGYMIAGAVLAVLAIIGWLMGG